jgi:hypothetical protein
MPFFLNNLHSQAANSRFGMTLSVNSMQASGRALQTARFLQADIAHLCSALHKLPALSLDRLFTRDQPTCRVNAATSSFSRCTLRIVHAHSGAGDLTRCGAVRTGAASVGSPYLAVQEVPFADLDSRREYIRADSPLKLPCRSPATTGC